MTKTLFIIGFLLLGTNLVKAQFWNWDTSFNTGIIINRDELIYHPTSTKINIDYQNGNYYFKVASPSNKGKDLNDFWFYSMNLYTSQVDSYAVDIPEKYLKSMKQQDALAAFVCNGDFVVIELYGHKLLIFKKKQKTYKFYSEILNRFCLRNDYFVLKDGTFLLTNYYDYHPLDCSYKFVIGKFNPIDGTITKNITNDKINGIEFSKYVHHWVDVSKERILVCKPVDMVLDLYDHDLNQIKNINLNELFPLVREGNRIEKCYLMDDSTIIISVVKSDIASNQRNIFVVRIGIENKILMNNVLDIKVVPMPTYKKDEQWLSIFWNSVPEYSFFNKKAVELNLPYQIKFWGNEKDKFKKLEQDFYTHNPRTIGVTFYSINVD